MEDPVLRRFFDQFLPEGIEVKSLPLKPVGFPIHRLEAHPLSRGPTVRSVACLAAAAAANTVPLEVGAFIPRYLTTPLGVVENGAGRDIIKIGLATTQNHCGKEGFCLTKLGLISIHKMLSHGALRCHFKDFQP